MFLFCNLMAMYSGEAIAAFALAPGHGHSSKADPLVVDSDSIRHSAHACWFELSRAQHVRFPLRVPHRGSRTLESSIAGDLSFEFQLLV